MNAALRRRALGLACAFLAFAGPCRSAPPVAAPGYVLADGSIRIVAEKTMEPVLSRLNTLMTRRHPELRFRMIFGDVPVGLDGIIARVSLFAPLAHDAWESEIDPFKRLNGYRPLDVRIGRLGHAGSGRANPPSIYVNAANPLRSLDIDRVSRVFTTGNLPSDLRRWNQLGVGDEWGKHAIHVYGTRDDGMTTTALRLARFGARPFVRHYEALPADRDVLEAVAGDRYGIGLAGFVAESDVPNAVRRLALSESPSAIASLASYEDVRAGRYALSPSLHFYVDRAPNSPLDSIAAEYIRLALSAEGQRILAELKDTAAGFVPLDPEEAARELAKLER